MLRTLRKAEYTELMILFFIQAVGMGAWFVPLGTILDAGGLHSIKPYAFAASAMAAIISPLMFGALADRQAPPSRVLRWLALATGISSAVIAGAIQWHCNRWLLLLLIQLFSLSYAPMFSISTALVLGRLADARREFGPIRSLATIGWMCGALLIGCLGLDRSPLGMYLDGVVWIWLALFTYFLPELKVPASAQNLTWHERLGLDALTLLKNRDVRVVFVATTLFNIPISAFYPYAPTHLHALGFEHTSAWMGLAQLTELIAMFSLAALLLGWRLKWIFAAGLGFGIARFALSGLDSRGGLLLGISLHRASYVLVFVTAQIYINQRIDPGWRTRAQALLTLLNSGAGNLAGYLGCGWWFAACTARQVTHWSLYWWGLSAMVAMVLIYFLRAFRDEPRILPVTASAKNWGDSKGPEADS